MASLALEFRRFADLWANAFGTVIFGATPRRFDSKGAVGAQIIRLAATYCQRDRRGSNACVVLARGLAARLLALARAS